MSANRIIKDGHGSGNRLKIGDEGELNAVIHPHPPINETVFPLPFSQFFTDNGKASGSSNMIVNGATNSIDFYIEAIPTKDIFIQSITVQISQNGARLDRFGALPALNNGVKFFYYETKLGELIISESIKSNLDYFRFSTGGKNFGDSTTSWRADVSGSGDDSYFPTLNFSERFGLVYGLRLTKGTTDKIVFSVRDNLTGLSTYNIQAYGLQL